MISPPTVDCTNAAVQLFGFVMALLAIYGACHLIARLCRRRRGVRVQRWQGRAPYSPPANYGPSTPPSPRPPRATAEPSYPPARPLYGRPKELPPAQPQWSFGPHAPTYPPRDAEW